jgi:hypothetical protein
MGGCEEELSMWDIWLTMLVLSAVAAVLSRWLTTPDEPRDRPNNP